MDVGRILGNVVCTVKQEALVGVRLCLVRIPADDQNGKILVAADSIRAAAEGALVYLIDGSEAAAALRRGNVPVDLAVAGLVEQCSRQ